MSGKRIEYSRRFKKSYQARVQYNEKIRGQFMKRVDVFLTGYRAQPLNDHALAGGMKGLRAFSITGDVRVIYRETDDCYEFLDIGTHAQVYGL